MTITGELILIIIGLIMIIGTMTYILVQDAYSSKIDCNKLNYSEFKDIEELRNITGICSNGG